MGKSVVPKLDTKVIQSAMRKAGGDALRVLKTETRRHVQERKRLKAKDISSALKTIYPGGGSRMVWQLVIGGKPTPLSKFPHRQTRRGVSVTVNRGARKVVKGAFVATMKSGHVGVFRRVGKSRLPIKELFSSSVADPVRDEGAQRKLERKAAAKYAETYWRLLKV